MKISRWAAIAVASSLLIAACGDADPDPTDPPDDNGAAPDEEEWPESIILGVVPSQEREGLVEDADRLAELLSAELGIDVEGRVTEDYTGLVVAMQTGGAHVGMFGPISLAASIDQAGAVAILQSVRRGASTYHTQWFTNDPARFCEDEPVRATNPEGHEFLYCNGTDAATVGPVGEEALGNIEAGETVFFVGELSASGYYYPAIQLREVAGLDPFTDIDAQFAGGHPQAAQAVLRGDGAVGVSFDDVRNVLIDDEPAIADELVVFAWSTEIPNDGISVVSDLPQSLIDAIRDAYLALTETEEGQQALLDIYEIEGLEPADPDAIDAARLVARTFEE